MPVTVPQLPVFVVAILPFIILYILLTIDWICFSFVVSTVRRITLLTYAHVSDRVESKPLIGDSVKLVLLKLQLS